LWTTLRRAEGAGILCESSHFLPEGSSDEPFPRVIELDVGEYHRKSPGRTSSGVTLSSRILATSSESQCEGYHRTRG
jgi:hypothetical protein